MRFQPSRVKVVSAAASLIGIALVANAVLILLDGQLGKALGRSGLGLYCCIWAFVPYNEFFRVAGMPVHLGDNAERKAYITLFPPRLLLSMALSIVLMISGFVCDVVDAFR